MEVKSLLILSLLIVILGASSHDLIGVDVLGFFAMLSSIVMFAAPLASIVWSPVLAATYNCGVPDVQLVEEYYKKEG